MMIDEETMHIAFCTDEHYVKYTGVAITSIILNNIGEKVCFHIFYSNINAEDKEKLSLLGQLYAGITVKWYSFDEITRFDAYKTGFHFTKVMFYRLCIPDIIDERITKILYLDGDVLCIGKIKALFAIDLENYTVMARGGQSDEDMQRLRLTANHILNSGELLINLAQWRRDKVTEKVLQILDERHAEFLWGDNDALNCYFDGEFMDMPKEYGKLIDCAVSEPPEIEPNDRIIHFLGGG